VRPDLLLLQLLPAAASCCGGLQAHP
jgi:hypothetical protein